MHRPVAVVGIALLTTACSNTVQFSPAVRTELRDTGAEVGAQQFRVLGMFELRAATRSTILVRRGTAVISSEAVDDSTVAVRVAGVQLAGPHDTLRLVFRASPAGGGSYTLRAVNDTPLGGVIPVGGTSYQYVPCYQNVGSKCLEPIPTGAREDGEVRLGLVR